MRTVLAASMVPASAWLCGILAIGLVLGCVALRRPRWWGIVGASLLLHVGVLGLAFRVLSSDIPLPAPPPLERHPPKSEPGPSLVVMLLPDTIAGAGSLPRAALPGSSPAAMAPAPSSGPAPETGPIVGPGGPVSGSLFGPTSPDGPAALAAGRDPAPVDAIPWPGPIRPARLAWRVRRRRPRPASSSRGSPAISTMRPRGARCPTSSPATSVAP